MKKGKSLFYVAVFMLLLAGCQDYNSTPVPTETVAPTATSIPEPTASPTPTAIPTPTEIVAPETMVTPTESPIHEHTWESKSTEATCTTNGSTWMECSCGETKDTVELFALGHITITNTIQEPTFEEDGLWEEVCTVCGEVVNAGTTTHEHIWEEKSKAATCTEAGSTWLECICGEQKNVVELPATDHEYEIVITKEVTVEEEGTYEDRCIACGAVGRTGIIEKLKPTPTPKPTSTPKPTTTPKPTATPTPDPFEEYTWWDVNHELIYYTDESKTKVEKIWYDLNLVMEYQYIENFSDEITGEQIDVYVYDYPSHDAKILHTIKTYPVPTSTIRGQIRVLERCVETGWYKVLLVEDDNDNHTIGYVDDEYMKCPYPSGSTNTGKYVPSNEYCQLEIPYLGPTHELKQPKDKTVSVGKSAYSNVVSKSRSLFFALYNPTLSSKASVGAQVVGIFSVENPDIVKINESDFYNSEYGHFALNGMYFVDYTGKSVGTTTITLTEYEISNYQYNDGNPTFDLGKKINEVSFDITVTEQ